MPSRITVAAGGLRLDAFLAQTGVASSATEARRVVTAGRVLVDGRRARKGQVLREGQVLEISDAGTPGDAMVPDPTVVLRILYQDDDLVAVDKPAGIPSHPLRPGEIGTAANGLVVLFPECAAVSDSAREGGLGHRLDRGTSGVLLAARNRQAWLALRQSLGGAGARKIYLAEVVGCPAVALIDAPIGRAGRRGTTVRIGGGRGPLPASTEIRIRERRGDTTVVEAILEKGRAHQVRAHLAHIGCPILGDAEYGDECARSLASERGVSGPRLHAVEVTLTHPVSGCSLTVVAPEPAWALRQDHK